MKYNCVVLLGPTAVGKTSLGVRIARNRGWDIISADSRQVYCGLDLGSGKDIAEYSQGGTPVPYHLIDITTLASEYNVYNFQKDFYSLFSNMRENGKMSFVVGGTGMYVDSIIRGYNFVDVPENSELRNQFKEKSLEDLAAWLVSLKPDLHNKSDLVLRDRVERALEIELFMRSPEGMALQEENLKREKVNAFVLGTTLNREKMHSNIKKRLDERIQSGMIEEVKGLHDSGYSWERLEKLGLEYRYISEYLEGKISSLEEMEDTLYHRICQFAKRQETWFRGMEKKGVVIHWLDKESSQDQKYDNALELLDQALTAADSLNA